MLGRRTGGQADRRTDVTLSKRSAARGLSLQWLAALFGVLGRIAGMPDYIAYIEHLRRHHPERAIPSEAQFYNDFIKARYGDGPTRCC